ncbi:MAG: hypothetical protein AAGI01_01175 [Myxococcota bacterium]
MRDWISAPCLVLASCCTALLCASACGGRSLERSDYTFPSDRPIAVSWISGAQDAALHAEPALDDLDSAFVRAEAQYWAGDLEYAFELYAGMLEADATHPLARFAAARLEQLHDGVLRYHERVKPVIAGIVLGDVHPLTAVSLVTIGQRVRWHEWYVSGDAEPFSGGATGFPVRWRISPQLSDMRLQDFDTAFVPEADAELAPTYLSPAIAEDVPQNYGDTEVFIAGGINLTPRPGPSGIYYLETFATVKGSKKQEYWVYANFPSAARVWIDGEELFERREDGYGTGRRLRRVTLSPGVHRVLIKLSYQRAYRDWLDVTFLNDEATGLEGSALVFSERRPDGGAGRAELEGDQHEPMDIEPFAVVEKPGATTEPMSLYLTALAAYLNRQPEFFERAARVLKKRAPKFAPIHGLAHQQVSTLWEVPSRLRDAQALQALRSAYALDPKSVRFTMELGDALRRRGKDREVRGLLEAARDAAVVEREDELIVRMIAPLNTWATYLENQGWDQAAEQAWREALDIAPRNCGAARRLQGLYHARGFFPNPQVYYDELDTCPSLSETWLRAQPERWEEKLELERREALRYPYRASEQVRYASALRALGRQDEARAVIESASARTPRSRALFEYMLDQAFAGGSVDDAMAVLDRADEAMGPSSWSLVERANLTGAFPMQELMADGVAAVEELVARETSMPPEERGGGDEAFYVIDFAARLYDEDGSSVTLTHTLVRVMTKGAIDEYAEFSVPRGARLLRARTIKQDGSTQVPEQRAGKDTLSMPGLAPGDFVEFAYLEYSGPSRYAHTRREGTRFFFKMQNISSVRSEYVVINPVGDFIRRHDAPEVERFTYRELPAVRFLREDSPKPRTEPASVGVEEYLPWVQLWRSGVTVDSFELARRVYLEQVLDASKPGQALSQRLAQWMRDARDLEGEAKVKKMFYDVSAFFPRPSSSLQSDVNHGVLTREGNPMLVLRLLLQRAGIPAEIYMVRSAYTDPQEHPLNEGFRYSTPLLRVDVPGAEAPAWLDPVGQDSMYNALGEAVLRQPAFCVTCAQARADRVRVDGIRRAQRTVKIDTRLEPSGDLAGVMRETFDGPTAALARGLLRQRSDETSRLKFMENLLAGFIPGSAVDSYAVEGGEDRDASITFVVEFSRPKFGRVSADGSLVVETAVFREPLASRYATLPQRTVPMMMGSPELNDDAFTMRLPDGYSATVETKSGSWTLDAPYGAYSRSVEVADGVLRVAASLRSKISRVMPEQYAEFQQWAIGVERSAQLKITLSPGSR